MRALLQKILFNMHYRAFKAKLTTADMLRFQEAHEKYEPGAASFDRSKLSASELARLYVIFELADAHYESVWPNCLGYFGADSPVVDNGFFYRCRYCGKSLILPEMVVYEADDGDFIFCNYDCRDKGRNLG